LKNIYEIKFGFRRRYYTNIVDAFAFYENNKGASRPKRLLYKKCKFSYKASHYKLYDLNGDFKGIIEYNEGPTYV